ncbi:uncharacterized protein LOC34621401 [Cyclospora cayetanensis]|uniref:Uncharacterized protein LOC34621401 n=1 Tax=Cyclospora cayetanensis TaxID=88456 RepID=A0A6P6RXF2_9EIME|nr:uncharacterized protein LOC34621401 [Cyclospora cayetanensis]
MSFFTSSSMDKLGSRLASLVSSASEKVKEAAERTITKETPLEKNLREALSDKNWGCATSILSEIARASYNYSDCVSISKTMWDAIGEPPKRWRRIFKGLTMLEYMLKNGTEKFAEEARDRSYLLRTLQSLSWSEEGRDKGAGIREKAGICTTLVFDAAELKAAREEAAKNRDKYIGISSASSMACRSSSRGHTAATGLGSDSRYSSNRDPYERRTASLEESMGSSRNSRGEESTPRVADVPSSANKEKHRASGKKEGAKKSDAASPENSKASPVAKSRCRITVLTDVAICRQQADLLGFDSPPIGTQATSVEASSFASGKAFFLPILLLSNGGVVAVQREPDSSLLSLHASRVQLDVYVAVSVTVYHYCLCICHFALSRSPVLNAPRPLFLPDAGNVWCEAPAAAGDLSLDSAYNFEAFLPPPPPGAGAPSGPPPPAELPGAPRTTGDIGSDDLFGCFQAASPPTTTGMSGSSNPLDAVAAAFAAPASPPATAGWTSGTSTGGKGLGTSSHDALQGLQQLNTEPPTNTPALFTLAKPSPTPAAAPQWQQPFTMGNRSNHNATNSINALPDPFSVSSSGTTSQTFTMGTSSSKQQHATGARHLASRPLAVVGTATQPWQQQAAAGSFASLEPGLF